MELPVSYMQLSLKSGVVIYSFPEANLRRKKIASSDISLCLFLGNLHFPKLLLDSEAFEICCIWSCMHAVKMFPPHISQPSMLYFDCWLYWLYAYPFNFIQILVLGYDEHDILFSFLFLSRQGREKAWKSSIEKLRIDYILSPSIFHIYTQ